MKKTVIKVAKSFAFALKGLFFVASQRNFRVHLLISVIVVLFGFLLQVSLVEWLVLFTMMALVFSAETVNTAIEETCNIIDELHGLRFGDTARPRNLAAGAVLILALLAALIGLAIFLPKLTILLTLK